MLLMQTWMSCNAELRLTADTEISQRLVALINNGLRVNECKWWRWAVVLSVSSALVGETVLV